MSRMKKGRTASAQHRDVERVVLIETLKEMGPTTSFKLAKALHRPWTRNFSRRHKKLARQLSGLVVVNGKGKLTSWKLQSWCQTKSAYELKKLAR